MNIFSGDAKPPNLVLAVTAALPEILLQMDCILTIGFRHAQTGCVKLLRPRFLLCKNPIFPSPAYSVFSLSPLAATPERKMNGAKRLFHIRFSWKLLTGQIPFCRYLLNQNTKKKRNEEAWQAGKLCQVYFSLICFVVS